ncbi:MAG: hypothetical protein J6M93_01580 [Succinivibrio sp.]|nr:hypothetical protein [Succinivibrio sp.]
MTGIDIKSNTLKEQLENLLSRCGVPLSEITYDELVVIDGVLDLKVMVKYAPKIRDKVFDRKDVEDKDVLSEIAMAEFSKNTVQALETGSSREVDDFSKSLEGKSIKELFELANQVNVISQKSAFGKTRCSSCQGVTKEKCSGCRNTGKIECTLCYGDDPKCTRCKGTGFITCPKCHGTGLCNCKACGGRGFEFVKRIVSLQANLKMKLSLDVNDENHPNMPPLILSDDQLKMMVDHVDMKLIKAEYEDKKNFLQEYRGKCMCYRQPVMISQSSEPFVYTAFGDDFLALDKPPIVDKIFEVVARQLDYTVHSTEGDSIEMKSECCRALAEKAFIFKTARIIHEAEERAVREIANSNNISERSLMDDAGKTILAEFKNAVKIREAEILTWFFKQQADGFVSDGFARHLCDNLVALVPMLYKLNPNSKLIWRLTECITWSLVGAMLFLLPYNSMLAVGLIFSVSFGFCISIFATKNLTFTQAVRPLKIRKNGRNIPDIRPEVINMVRLLLVTCLIEVFMKMVWFPLSL